MKMRNLPLLLVLGSVAALPACSMYGGHGGGQQGYTMPQPAGVSADTIRTVQSRLRQEGDYNGAIDGIWGPSTVEAVRAYQQHHGLAVTGELDPPTMAAINAAGMSSPGGSGPTQPMAQPQQQQQTAPKTP